MTLHEFLTLPHRFRWGGMGGDDCTTWCASWIRERIGSDPAATLRGTYRDEEGAHRILIAAGGIVPFMASHLLPLGFAPTDAPAPGDLGVVRVAGTSADIAAINFGPLWAMLSPGRVVAKKAEIVTAWRFPE